MPVMLRTATITAATTTPNVFNGSTFEYARFRQLLSMGIVANDATITVLVNVGADVVAEEHIPKLASVQPVIPDDFYYQDIAEQGDRIVLQARNSDAADHTVRAVCIITGA